MAMHVPRTALQSMMKEGSTHAQGMDEAVYRNISACKNLANTVSTSFGPNGMNKMVINHLEKLFVTNDAATIVSELDVEHPAAKMIVMASQMQLQEVGDGTNLVIMFAGELLSLAEGLLKMGLHPSEVVTGYEMALKMCLETLETLICHEVKDITDRDAVINVLKTSIASKQYGYEEALAGYVADACLKILPKKNPAAFNIDSVRIVKILGGGVMDTRVMNGMVFAKEPDGHVKSVKNAKVLVLGCPLDIAITETKGTVLIKSAKQLSDFSREEEKLLDSQIKEIADSGVQVIVAGGKVGEMALHFCNRYNILVLRLTSKFELRRLTKVIGATALPRVGPPTAEEAGHCHDILVEEIGGSRVTVFRQKDESSMVSTIIVRGSSKNIMDDIERAIDDGVNVFKSMTKGAQFVPGAGATEIELAKRLAAYGETCPGLEQYAIKKFAEAFEIVPRSMADNAGTRSTELISNMYAAHAAGKTSAGFDVESGEPAIMDAQANNVLDLLATKWWAIKFAVNAAVTVLRIDQIIMSKPAGGPKAPKQGGRDQED